MFQLHDPPYRLHSGGESRYKVECDAATQGDIDCWAFLITKLVGPFSSVEGIPRGGVRLAGALDKLGRSLYCIDNPEYPHLIVDDVLTKGTSMGMALEKYLSGYIKAAAFPRVVGAVVFARGPLLSWVRAVVTLPRERWEV
jgi:hypothetical protein